MDSQQRQQPHHYQSEPQTSRPSYAQFQAQSAPASAFQSSSSLASVSSIQPRQSPFPIQTSGLASAPLPSPSMQRDQANYFPQTAAQGGPTSHPQSHAQQQRIPQQQSGPAVTQAFMGQRGGGNGGMPETTPFLQDFNLVAEAAKRAQMACLMRDMDDISL